MNCIYSRVLPRDLFNEAKLLKCLGKLCLHIHDGNKALTGLKFEHETIDDEGFIICQDDNDASLFILNIVFTFNDRELYFYTKYNSREDWPLFASFNDDHSDEVNVFDLFGNIDEGFINLINNS